MQLTKGLISGVFFIVTGLLFLVTAVASYDMGTLARMGPGYFPTIAGGGLVVVGVVSVLTAGQEANRRPERIYFWPLFFVGLSLAVFALLASRFGFVISLSLAILIVSLARRDMSIMARLIMVVGVTAVLVTLFRVFLDVPIPVWPEF